MKQKLLMIGDNEKAPYHPLREIEPVIESILQPEFEVCFSEDYEEILSDYSRLEQFELVVSYLDRWEEPLNDLQTGNLLRYFSVGKGLVAIHCGISLQARHEFKHIIGARFIKHPPLAKLEFFAESKKHPISEGINVFEIEDEPYLFEFDNFSERELFLHYKNSNKEIFPAGWITYFGPAKIIYLMPGHSCKSFENKIYQQLLLQSIRFTIESKGGDEAKGIEK
ncbi:MAG TPA: ThuA domain-containing protein [Candidatus Atribacteria bacterium]|nr:ThuA domain-containing protein [Candidatus Atribacteria bacterium]